MLRHISINHEIHLSPPGQGDLYAFVQHLNEREIHDRTLTIPYPYTLKDAEWFLRICEMKRHEYQREMQWSVRNNHGQLIGGIGFHGNYPNQKHREEVGYWLSKPLWNKGIMSKVLARFCEHGFKECGYSRIEAPIFINNLPSQRVVEKCGFVREGVLKKAYFKDGNFIDGLMYSLTNA
jgi:ribosomal-protein-alanine N-acetyltransferase